MFELTSEKSGGTHIFRLKESIHASNAKQLEEQLAPVLEADSGPVIVDFADVEYVSSAGLRVLLLTRKKLVGQDRGFAVTGLTPFVADIVKLTGIDKLIDCYDAVQDALAVLDV